MPLVRSFALSTKPGKKAWVEPTVDQAAKCVRFNVREGEGAPEGTVNRKGAHCLSCGTAVPFDYIRAEGRARRMGAQLMAIVADTERGRVYLAPNAEHEQIAGTAKPENVPETNLPEKALSFRVQVYGMTRHRDLFTPRQLVALTTLSDLVADVRLKALSDGASVTYADSIATYLALVVSRLANTHCSLAVWSTGRDQSVNVFSRQALPMTWDYPEVNLFAGAAGDFAETAESASRVIAELGSKTLGVVRQVDATVGNEHERKCLFATDPPYYDNIGYADLSDFFYIWLRRSLSTTYPDSSAPSLSPRNKNLLRPHIGSTGVGSAPKHSLRKDSARRFRGCVNPKTLSTR